MEMLCSSLHAGLAQKCVADQDSSARGGHKEPLKSQNPEVINQNECVELDVSAHENSAGMTEPERPRREASDKARSRIRNNAALENQDSEVIDQDEHAEDDAATGSKGCPATRSSRAQSTVCQVPRLLRQANVHQKQNCYEPQLISIGPLHHKKKRLRPMEQLKLQFRQKLLDRNKKVRLEDYRNKMVKLEQRAKKCYSSQSISKFSSDDFVEMMLLDGCFLVEMLLQNNEATVPKAPTISKEIWFLDFVSRDMLLLENQLPYFVLDSIFKLFLQYKKKSDVDSMAKLVLACFQFTGLPLNAGARFKKSYLHLLHFHHHHCLPHDKEKNPNTTVGAGGGEGISLAIYDPHVETYTAVSRGAGGKPLSIPSAEEMEEAGITFKPHFPGSFLSIKFSKDKGVLQIPYLYFGDGLYSLIRNLVAFEQCSCWDAKAFFVGYVLFMDFLISSGRDVAILRHSEVLDHGLGSDGELADVINQMSIGVVWDPEQTPLADLYKDINEYCRRRRNRWRAYFKRNYWKTPFAQISLLGAIFLLLLTVTQTYFAIFPRS